MRNVACLLAFLLVAAGCSKDSGSGQSATQPEKPKHNPDAKYQGVTAKEWGERLFDADQQTYRQAMIACNDLGDDGTPYLVNAALKKAPFWRDCFRSLTLTKLKPYMNEIDPFLRKLLKDKDEAATAAGILVGWGKDAEPFAGDVRQALKENPANKDLKRFTDQIESNLKKK